MTARQTFADQIAKHLRNGRRSVEFCLNNPSDRRIRAYTIATTDDAVYVYTFDILEHKINKALADMKEAFSATR